MDSNSYLCENGIILHYIPAENAGQYAFYKIGNITGDGNDFQMLDQIWYHAEENCWMHIVGGEWWNEERITEEAAMGILASYNMIDLQMKPIGEFPME